MKISRQLSPDLRQQLEAEILQNVDLFAWSSADMPGIDTDFIYHKLAIHKVGGERREAIITETQKLLNAGFIREVRYTTWLANVVLVKKSSGKWCMCVDYTDLNKACPKDSYPLLSIDRLVDGASGHALLSFLDAYSGYNQIMMYPSDEVHTSFITDHANYCYRVMSFDLKNAGATYQRLMDKVFHQQIGRNMEVYVNDPTTAEEPQVWTLHVDGSSNSKGGGAGSILEGPNQVTLEQSLKFSFKVTNNQAEYEALLVGLRLARDLGTRRVSCNSDSKLMVEQLNGTYQANVTLLQRYFHVASHQISSFDEFTIQHVPREQNTRADLLSKLASTKRPGQHRTIIQETLHSPSLDDKVVNVSDSEDLGWMTSIWGYLKEGILPKDKDEARKMRMRSAKFVIIGD
uniref:Transposon Ty3-G Gag-Pol polyprotein n=1 Tax=Cajanus cajan TaxID=3821 RepID=A0A151TE33_CAJCA|nr:Transposon Ty3-G Gag-Pol polyprotein [Cajanus cajan]